MEHTWVELDLGILAANIRGVRQVLTKDTEIIFVVKSNAYGHGMAPVAACAWRQGVRWFAVARMDEALRLREQLPEPHILIMNAIGPDDVPAVLAHSLTPVIVSETQALALASAASAAGRVLRCHAKVDTGMGRLGIAWEDAADTLARLAGHGGLDIAGICTHLASSDSPRTDFAEIQTGRFHAVAQACGEKGLHSLFKHVSNSGGVLRDTGWDMDGVRLGILLYGYGPKMAAPIDPAREGGKRPETEGVRQPHCRQVETRPFLQWKSRVVQLKRVPARFPVSYHSTHVTPAETHIATIDVGYADGYWRALGNRGGVIVNGQRRPVVGRVTMNLTMVDLGPVTEVKEGDEVTLLGGAGAAAVWADELAALCDTISYEVLTNIRTDVRRVREE